MIVGPDVSFTASDGISLTCSETSFAGLETSSSPQVEYAAISTCLVVIVANLKLVDGG